MYKYARTCVCNMYISKRNKQEKIACVLITPFFSSWVYGVESVVIRTCMLMGGGQDKMAVVRWKFASFFGEEIASQVLSSYIRLRNASRPESTGILCSTSCMPYSLYRSHFCRDGVCVGRMKAAIRDVWGLVYSKFAIFMEFVSPIGRIKSSANLPNFSSLTGLPPWLHGPLLLFWRSREDVQWPKGEWRTG